MRAKSLLLLIVALGCGMIAMVAASKVVLKPEGGPVAEATVEIFVAVKDLGQGQKITADGVKLEKWPKNRLPEGAIVKLDELEGKFTNQIIFASEPILEKTVSNSRDSFSTGIPPGYRIFDIEGSGGYIKPGDHVDIVGTFALGGRNAVPESRTVMRNVKVHGINGIATRDSEEINNNGRKTMFQLLVKESQLEALTLANRLGELRMNLRPFGEDNSVVDTDNGESFLSWINTEEDDVVPVEIKIQDPLPVIETKDEKQQTLAIITPEGVTHFVWSNPNELPRKVDPFASNTPATPEPAAANAWGTPSGNVYSDYGNYKPTYPTSTSPSSANGAQAPQGQGSENEERALQ